MRTALSVAANKAWLEVKNTNARAINIVLDDATGVQPTPNPSRAGGEIYDLSGRKVKSPTRKGVYIENGHKKVIK